MDRKEVISFRKIISGESELDISERVKDYGTVENIKIKFYQGQQLALQIRPIILKAHGTPVDLISYAEETDEFLSGDDDYFIYDINIPVSIDNQIILKCKNLASFDVNVVVDVTIDYLAGTKRVVG